MIKIKRTEFGIHLTFAGLPQRRETEQWLEDSKPVLAEMSGGFGVFVDMRELILLPPESQPALREGQTMYRESGMVRSVVILRDELILMQFKRIAKQTGIYEWERYIDSESEPNWEQVGLDWLVDGIDPDKIEDPQPQEAKIDS